MFEIICKELTSDRRKIIAAQEVAAVGKPLRGVMAVGGVWIFFYATDTGIPESVQSFAVVFTIVGLIMVLFAIFSQKLVEMSYFFRETRRGCFPESVSVKKGGVYVRRREIDEPIENAGVTSVNAEKFFAYPEVGGVEDFGDYFKLRLLRGGTPGVFLFKKDFGKGDPEAFEEYISKRHLRSK